VKGWNHRGTGLSSSMVATVLPFRGRLHREVFRLPNRLTHRVFPSRLNGTVTYEWLSSPVTAAGPRRICTVFRLYNGVCFVTVLLTCLLSAWKPRTSPSSVPRTLTPTKIPGPERFRSGDAVFHPQTKKDRPFTTGTSLPTACEKVFRLPDHLTRRVFPSRLSGTVTHVRLSSPVTAAGPRRICTVFPVKAYVPLGLHLVYRTDCHSKSRVFSSERSTSC